MGIFKTDAANPYCLVNKTSLPGLAVIMLDFELNRNIEGKYP
jgi:hypothetical protein